MWKIEAPFRVLSDWTTLKDGAGPVSRHHTLECESAAAEQRSVLGLGPLASAAPDEPHVKKLVRVRLVRRLRDAFDEQQSSVRSYRASALTENLQRGVVVPVVNNATEDVRVTVGRDRLKEVPADDLAAFDDIRGTERFGTRDDVGEI